MSARHRAGYGVVVVLLALSLGLPWTVSTSEYLPGWITPSFCTTNIAEGTMDCTPMYVSPGMTIGSPQAAGSATVARVPIVASFILLAVAARRGRPELLRIAAGGLILGVFLSGLTMLSGQITAVAAAVVLVLLARDADRTPGRSWRRFTWNASTPPRTV